VHIVIIWQRFLPYHIARINHARKKLEKLGHRLTAMEVSSNDVSYSLVPKLSDNAFEHICCFPDSSYHSHSAGNIHRKVLDVLESIGPDVVFAPASAFPEGMAAVTYRCSSGGRVFMMDDAWERTDLRGPLARYIKRRIHRNIDAAFVPAPSHRDYFFSIGFPEERIVYGVDVVDNGYFSSGAEAARLKEEEVRTSHNLPSNYFLFVGRFVERKGLATLIEAFGRYRAGAAIPWDLVIVGDGPDADLVRDLTECAQGIHLVGPKYGDVLCKYYALARVLIVPSLSDPWGLVINEGMASGLPVIVSRGCGAARSLIKEGENGWSFNPGDVEALTDSMSKTSSLQPDALKRFGEASRQIIADWSLDRFVDGVKQAIDIPRRPPAGLLSNMLTQVWKGRISVN